MRFILLILITFLFNACSILQPKITKSAVILIKTPTMRYYDSGFITKFSDHIELQIYNAGNSILELKIYKDQICKDTFACQNSTEFNKQFLHKSYKKDFLYNLFSKPKVNFKDLKHHIKIKVIPID
jgi:hypothetical protein